MPNDPKEASGIWWLAGHTETKVFGTLSWSELGPATLTINGSITDTKWLARADHYFEIINGQGMGDFTLQDCTIKEFMNHSNKFCMVVLWVRRIFKGVLFESPNQIVFNKVLARYCGLDDWLNQKPFIWEPYEDERINIRYEPEVGIPVDVNEELTLKTCRRTLVSNGIRSVKLVHENQVEFSLSKPANLDTFLAYVTCFQRLLSLLANRLLWPVELAGETQAGHTKTVGISFSSSFFGREEPKIHIDDMLVRYNDTTGRFPEILRKWFAASKRIANVIDLYFSQMSDPAANFEGTLLAYAIALEAYFPRAHWNSNDHSDQGFRKSLEAVVDHLRSVEKLALGNRALFLERFVDTRNFLVHYNPKKANRAAQGKELEALVYQSELLLVGCFLSEIGFDDLQIRDALRGTFGPRTKIRFIAKTLGFKSDV